MGRKVGWGGWPSERPPQPGIRTDCVFWEGVPQIKDIQMNFSTNSNEHRSPKRQNLEQQVIKMGSGWSKPEQIRSLPDTIVAMSRRCKPKIFTSQLAQPKMLLNVGQARQELIFMI